MKTKLSSEALEIRRIFLREVTRNLIENSLILNPTKRPPMRIAKEIQIKENKEIPQKSIKREEPKKVVTTEVEIPKKMPPIPLVPRRNLPPQKNIRTVQIRENKFSNFVPMIQSEKPQIIKVGTLIPKGQAKTSQGLDLGKITPLLMDPSVQSVECPGPVKPVLVNKSGVIQTTSINLTKEEINAIIKSIAEQTRIPAESGVFKAAFGNYIITAVISDYVGTRFIIQKRNPFQPFT